MHIAHRHQAPLAQRAAPPLAILEAEAAQQHAAAQIELLAIRQELDAARIEPVLLGDAKRQRQPVGAIHQILVFDEAAGDVGAQAVVAAGEVGPRIVNVIGLRPGGGAARREIAVPQRAQGFADALLRRVEVLEHQRPGGRRLHCHLNLAHIGHHDIGAAIAQRLRVVAAIDADDAAEAAGAPGLDAGDRVLHDDGARRFCPDAPRRLQKSIRRRLALEFEAGHVRPVHARVEQLRDAGCLEHRRAVVAGGHHGGLDILRPQCAHQRDRRGIRFDAVLLQVLQEIAVFQIPQRVHALHLGAVFGCAQGQFDPARLEKGCDAVVTRLAVDVARIVGGDIKGHERLARLGGALLEKPVEQLFPGRGMHARAFSSARRRGRTAPRRSPAARA